MPQDTTESTLVFTKGRDIHAVGIALVQMLMGRDVMDRFPDPQSALHTSEFRGYVRRDVYSPERLQPPYLPSSSRRRLSCSLRRGRMVFPRRASLETSCPRRPNRRATSALRLFRFQDRRPRWSTASLQDLLRRTTSGCRRQSPSTRAGGRKTGRSSNYSYVHRQWQ